MICSALSVFLLKNYGRCSDCRRTITALLLYWLHQRSLADLTFSVNQHPSCLFAYEPSFLKRHCGKLHRSRDFQLGKKRLWANAGVWSDTFSFSFFFHFEWFQTLQERPSSSANYLSSAKEQGEKKEKIKIHFTKKQTPFFSFVFILISLSLKVHNFLIPYQIERFKAIWNCHLKHYKVFFVRVQKLAWVFGMIFFFSFDMLTSGVITFSFFIHSWWILALWMCQE